MSAQPSRIEPLAHPVPAVADLDDAREVRSRQTSELELLRTRLQTERSAASALIAAMAELEQRLAAERETGKQLQTTIEQHEATISQSHEEILAQRRDYARLSYELNHVVRQLAEAQRPLWRKVFSRTPAAL